jgi:hypothetical protein
MRRLLFSLERFEPGLVVNADITLWTVSGPTIMTQRKRSEEKRREAKRSEEKRREAKRSEEKAKVKGNEYVFAKKKRRERRKRTGNGIERKGYSDWCLRHPFSLESQSKS